MRRPYYETTAMKPPFHETTSKTNTRRAVAETLIPLWETFRVLGRILYGEKNGKDVEL